MHKNCANVFWKWILYWQQTLYTATQNSFFFNVKMACRFYITSLAMRSHPLHCIFPQFSLSYFHHFIYYDCFIFFHLSIFFVISFFFLISLFSIISSFYHLVVFSSVHIAIMSIWFILQQHATQIWRNTWQCLWSNGVVYLKNWQDRFRI